MKNGIFDVGFDKEKGLLISLSLVGDPENANFIKKGRGLFELRGVPFGQRVNGAFVTQPEGYQLLSFEENDERAKAKFARRGVEVEEEFFFDGEYLKVKCTVRNQTEHPVYYKREDFAFYTPFADSYDSSEISTKVRCHTHIADFGQASYIRTERMGESEHHVGLVFTDADIHSYSQEDVPTSNDRGFFVMNVAPFVLQGGDEKSLEAVLFAHKGGEDFFRQAEKLKEFMRVECKDGFTFFIGQKREIIVSAGEEIFSATAVCDGKRLPCKIEKKVAKFLFKGKKYGEKRVELCINGKRTHADFFVSYPLEEILKRRLNFIVDKQQCLDESSPLYGAFLIYDNEEQAQYFNYDWSDHNACRERMGMPILLAKYLRTHKNPKFRAALDKFTEFLCRECFNTDTGEVYNNIGKDAKTVRLYNAPWVALYFTELYELDGKEEYATWVARTMIRYHENGGTKFYPNGIRFIEFARAVEKSGHTEDYKRMRELFDEHIENLVQNGTNYPPHEVNYEQTIVTPATSLMMDQYQLTGEEKYLRETEKHLSLLRKFDGAQPDCHRNKIPIRFWDDYWFGKEQARVYGDTFPHYWSSLSGACYDTYGKLTGKKEWCAYGRQTIENCYCLYAENGEGSCAYVKPYRVNGVRGEFYDPFGNDQDFALYFAIKLDETI